MDLEIVSFYNAGKILSSHSNRDKYQALISIGDPLEPYPSGFKNVSNSLRLEFHDVDVELLKYRTFVRNEIPPGKDDVLELIRFAEGIKDEVGKCLIHCHGGVARSPAAGFIANCIWMGPGKEDQAMEATLASCSEAWVFPNDIMINIADDLLNRDGAMAESLGKFCSY